MNRLEKMRIKNRKHFFAAPFATSRHWIQSNSHQRYQSWFKNIHGLQLHDLESRSNQYIQAGARKQRREECRAAPLPVLDKIEKRNFRSIQTPRILELRSFVKLPVVYHSHDKFQKKVIQIPCKHDVSCKHDEVSSKERQCMHCRFFFSSHVIETPFLVEEHPGWTGAAVGPKLVKTVLCSGVFCRFGCALAWSKQHILGVQYQQHLDAVQYLYKMALSFNVVPNATSTVDFLSQLNTVCCPPCLISSANNPLFGLSEAQFHAERPLCLVDTVWDRLCSICTSVQVCIGYPSAK